MKKIILSLLLLLPATLQAEEVIQGNTVRSCQALTVTAGAYVANQLVGTKITFSNVFRPGIYSGIVQDAEVTDAAGQGVNYDLVLFNADPTGTTFTNGAAFAISDSDLTKALPPILISVQTAFNDNGISSATNLSRAVKNAGAVRDLFGGLVTRGAPTYAVSTDVNVCITVIQD
jgi:hypothetical protein